RGGARAARARAERPRALAGAHRQADDGLARGPRHRRQGWRDQHHRRAAEPAPGAHRRTAEAGRARSDAVVLPALCRAPAGGGRAGAVRPQLVQPRRRREGDGLLYRRPVQAVPETGAGVREAAGRRRHPALQVLAVGRPGVPGGALRRARRGSAQALETLADRPEVARALRRLRPRARRDVRGHAHEARAVVRRELRRPAPRPAQPDPPPARPGARPQGADRATRVAAAAGHARQGALRRPRQADPGVLRMTNTRLRIAVCDDYERAALAGADWSAIRERADVVVFEQPFGDVERTIDALRDFDAVCLMRGRTPFPATVIGALPNLKFIVFTGERNAAVDHDAAARRGIPVSFTPGGPSKASTAELTWALILAATKRVVQADGGTRAGHWRLDAQGRRYALPANLEGQRLGLVGLGQIGARVARGGRAFGMDVVAWSQNLDDARAAEVGVRRVPKQELFETSAAVSLHLVLSARTRGIVGAADLARMRPDAVIVNTSRSGLMDERAL